jgi:chemotaxis protein CheZ
MTAGAAVADPLPGAEVTPLRALLREELAGGFTELRRFIDRRFSELSAEVHGAVQMVDFSEATLTEQLKHIHSQIAAVLAAPVHSARNSGLELEAVVQATESAAERILQAAEAIGDWAANNGRDPAESAQLTARVNAIFEACAFQDLTGQRIHRAIGSLQQVEALLSALIAGGDDAAGTNPTALPAAVATEELDQQEIDRLLG